MSGCHDERPPVCPASPGVDGWGIRQPPAALKTGGWMPPVPLRKCGEPVWRLRRHPEPPPFLRVKKSSGKLYTKPIFAGWSYAVCVSLLRYFSGVEIINSVLDPGKRVKG